MWPIINTTFAMIAHWYEKVTHYANQHTKKCQNHPKMLGRRLKTKDADWYPSFSDSAPSNYARDIGYRLLTK